MGRLPGHIPILRASLFALLITLASFAQQPKVLAPHRPIAPKMANPLPLPPAVPGSMVGGPWITDANFKSSIYLKNVVETSPVTVTPVLYLSNGAKYVLPDVTLEPAGTAIVDINAGLQAQGIASYATLSGYVELRYNWPWDPICALIRDVDVAHSLIFTYGVQAPPAALPQNPSAAPASHVIEGVWWKQEANVTGFVSLANTSSETQSATVQVSDNHAAVLGTHRVTISPHGMKTLNLRELQSPPTSEGGIRISYVGRQDALLINGGLEDQSVGYSANLHFASDVQRPLPAFAQATKAASVAALGLMVGAADPMMLFPAGTTFTPYSVLRNVSGAPVSVTPTLWWMQNGAASSASTPQVTLLPYQSRSLDVMGVISAAGLKNFNGSVNLVFDVPGTASGLLLAAGSVDQTNTYVFEVAARGVVESAGKSISYWSTGNGDDTMVTLWNPGDEARDFVFRLIFSGGHYGLPIHLEARATRTFNISEIIQNQVPDSEGNIVPATVQVGSAKILGAHADNEPILIATETGVYNVRKATCGLVCMTCDGATGFSMVPSPFTIVRGGQGVETFLAQWSTGGQYDYTSASNWNSSNTAVATVQAGLGQGVSAGSVTFGVGNSTIPNYTSYNCYYENTSCPIYQGGGAGASGTVTDNTPIVTGISPSDWTSGATTPSVTFTGQYFGTNAPTLTFSPSSGISYSLGSYNDTQIIANITVASGTPNEDVTVSVTNNGYGGLGFQSGGGSVSPISAAVHATVHAPMNSPEVTVIAWVNPAAPDLVTLPTGENSTLQTLLQNSTVSQSALCAGLVSDWSLFLIRSYVITPADVAYANAWLVKNSANAAPPATITPSAQYSGGNYRLFNDFGNGKGGYNVGITPDPCKTGIIPGWVAAGQPSQYMGASGTSPTGKVYQLAEGRIGIVGQRGSQTINGGRTVPWIWSVIEFDSSGNPTYSDVGMFPTYSVYKNGSLVATYAQSSVSSFIAKDQTYQRTPSQIQ